jgi:hypothetical protein
MKLLRLVREMLREIFDEAAYERFCQRARVSPGPASYMHFCRETSCTAKVKCC